MHKSTWYVLLRGVTEMTDIFMFEQVWVKCNVLVIRKKHTYLLHIWQSLQPVNTTVDGRKLTGSTGLSNPTAVYRYRITRIYGRRCEVLERTCILWCIVLSFDSVWRQVHRRHNKCRVRHCGKQWIHWVKSQSELNKWTSPLPHQYKISGQLSCKYLDVMKGGIWIS